METARLKKINPWRRSVLSKLLFKQPKAHHCGAHIFSGWKAHEDSQSHPKGEGPSVLNMGRKGQAVWQRPLPLLPTLGMVRLTRH